MFQPHMNYCLTAGVIHRDPVEVVEKEPNKIGSKPGGLRRLDQDTQFDYALLLKIEYASRQVQ